MTFDLCIGIDYSGAQTPTSRLRGLQVYAAKPGEMPEAVKTPAIAASASEGRHAQSTPRYWTRAEIAHWLIALARDGVRYIAGIDHGFTFPESYFRRYGLKTWPQFLDDFVRFWPTDQDHVYVDFVREGILAERGGPPAGAWRRGG